MRQAEIVVQILEVALPLQRGLGFGVGDALPDQARVMRPSGQVVTLDVIGSEQLVERRLLEPLPQFSHRAEDHAPANTHHAPSAVLVLDRLPVQQVRIPPALRVLAGPPAFRFGRVRLYFGAVVLG